MNLLLTSCGLETETIRQAFLQMLRKPAGQTKALFIPTAANSPDAVEVLPKCLGDLLRCDIPRENIRVYDLHDPLEPDWISRPMQSTCAAAARPICCGASTRGPSVRNCWPSSGTAAR